MPRFQASSLTIAIVCGIYCTLEFSHTSLCLVSHPCSAKADFPLFKVETAFDVLLAVYQTGIQANPNTLSRSHRTGQNMKIVVDQYENLRLKCEFPLGNCFIIQNKMFTHCESAQISTKDIKVNKNIEVTIPFCPTSKSCLFSDYKNDANINTV